VPQRVIVVDHPVLADRLTVMRNRDTGHGEFRQALFEASAILAVEAARELPVEPVEIDTPLERTSGSRLPKEIAVVPVLRAGLGMVEAFLRLLPDARVGHLGLYRDEETLEPFEYYERLPARLDDAYVFVVDPMLATGGSSVQAIARLKRAGAQRITFVCLVAAPEGVTALRGAHPEVPILTAALDRELDGNGYIRPGLGDAGDRIFGTDR
jgi:uracil phosphoribosyltransferase